MNDITQVVEYGRLRGVRIIVEIDAPAHSGKSKTINGLHKYPLNLRPALCRILTDLSKLFLRGREDSSNQRHPNLVAVLYQRFESMNSTR